MCLTVQAYLHHIFGSSAFFDDEGAEARGSMTLPPPLADPYYYIVNGTNAANVVTRSAESLAHIMSIGSCVCTPLKGGLRLPGYLAASCFSFVTSLCHNLIARLSGAQAGLTRKHEHLLAAKPHFR